VKQAAVPCYEWLDLTPLYDSCKPLYDNSNLTSPHRDAVVQYGMVQKMLYAAVPGKSKSEAWEYILR
jgi:hypothetical protein